MKKVFLTALPKTNRKTLLKALEERYPQKIKVYFIGEELEKIFENLKIKINFSNILNLYSDYRRMALSTTFEKIIKDFEKNANEKHIIIESHNWFLLKHLSKKGFNSYDLEKYNPDIYMTYYESPIKALENLKKDEKWRYLTLEKVILWQDFECETNESNAEKDGKKHHVIFETDTLENIIDLIEGNKPIAYISFPMTNLPDKKKKKIKSFIEKLRKYFILRVPVEDKIEFASSDKKNKAIISAEIVKRDLHWFVRKSDIVISNIPELVFTQGVISEIKEGYDNTKYVFVVGSKKLMGPFEQFYRNRYFPNEDKFFNWLDKNYDKLKKEICK